MELENYTPNSNVYRERNAVKQTENDATCSKKEKVTTGKVSTKKQPLSRKMAGNFFTEDMSKVKDYLIYDVAIPALKKLISEGISSGVDMILYGETRRHDTRSSGGTRTQYNKMYDDRGRSAKVATRNGSYDYDEIEFASRGDAEKTLDEMFMDVDRYGAVSVANMYDYAGVSSDRYTDFKYGWTSLAGASVGHNGNGTYYLRLPRCVALD